MDVASIVQWLLFGVITLLVGVVAYFGKGFVSSVKELTQSIQNILITLATHNSRIDYNEKDIAINKKDISNLDRRIDNHDIRISQIEGKK